MQPGEMGIWFVRKVQNVTWVRMVYVSTSDDVHTSSANSGRDWLYDDCGGDFASDSGSNGGMMPFFSSRVSSSPDECTEDGHS